MDGAAGGWIDQTQLPVSVTGRRWCLPKAGEDAVAAVRRRLDVPDSLARILVARGIDAGAAPDFMTPSLRALLPDPSLMTDMDRLADRLASAVMQGERIAIFGDYDVDGATSTALLLRFLRALGAAPLFHIPDRLSEGYGPSEAAFAHLADQGARVLVTVDCGSAAHAPVALAVARGMDVLVLDHHEPGETLPPAYAIVNPQRADDSSPCGSLAAVGVTFLAVVAVQRALRQAGWFATRDEPDLRQWLDLVALGTVCDVMPLTGCNRAFVAQGLKILGQRSNLGLATLADVAGVTPPPDAYHLGFVLGPRVNAGGRVGQADFGTRLLATEDPVEARSLAEGLERFNDERRELEAAVMDEALAQIETNGGEDAPILLVGGEDWHPGVIGIVASRLVDRFQRPACVMALNAGIGRGSGRSVPGIDLGAAVVAAHAAGLLAAGGGHPMAAGFTVNADKIPEFCDFLTARILSAAADSPQARELHLDGVLSVSGASLEFGRELARLAPFGAGNREPRFALLDARIAQAQPVGRGHVRCRLADIGGGSLDAIAFRCGDTALGALLLNAHDRPVHIAGRLRVDRWQGVERLQVMIDDAISVR